MHRFLAVFFVTAACGSNAQTTPDAANPPPPDSDDTPSVTFSYTPGWDGVSEVDVIGAFNQAGDWTTPLLSLTSSGGTWTGTAKLPAGTYQYVFHVIGDAAAGSNSGTYDRYAFDPASTDHIACPADSPTYSAEMNPCSQVTVPVVAPTMSHVTGRAVVDGAATAGFIVLIERQETDTHHFFVNRATTGADGSYDFAVAPGSYRIQVQHPDYLDKTDAQLDPVSLGTLRRNLTKAFPVAADVAVSDGEMAFHDYAMFTPSPDGTLPTAFTFSTTKSVLDVYGDTAEVGDPWFAGTATKTGTTSFDGTFNTPKAKQQNADMNKRYFWGVEQTAMADDHGIVWTAQTLVFPITWTVITSQ